MVQRCGWLRRARPDYLVPRLDVGTVRMVVDVLVRPHELAQRELVVEGARLFGGAGDGEGCRRTRCEVATVEGGMVEVDHAWAGIGARVALEPLVGRKKCQADVGDGGSGGGDVAH